MYGSKVTVKTVKVPSKQQVFQELYKFKNIVRFPFSGASLQTATGHSYGKSGGGKGEGRRELGCI